MRSHRDHSREDELGWNNFSNIYKNLLPERDVNPKFLQKSYNTTIQNPALSKYFKTIQILQNDSNTKYYYHGTIALVSESIEPSKSKFLADKKVVMATDSMTLAILFTARWGLEDFELESRTNFGGISNFVLKEVRPDALEEKLGVSGYVYYLPSDKFKQTKVGSKQLLWGHGFISMSPVKIIKKIIVNNVLEELMSRNDIKIVKYG